MSKNPVKELKDEIKGMGFDDDFVENLHKRLSEDDPRIEQYADNPIRADIYSLNNLKGFLTMLKDIPEEKRAVFIEDQMRLRKNERRLFRFRKEIRAVNPLSTDRNIELRKRIMAAIKEAELDYPGFKKIYGWESYSTIAYLFGMSTAGSIGCMSMLDRVADPYLDGLLQEIFPDDPEPRDTLYYWQFDRDYARESVLKDRMLIQWIMQDINKHMLSSVPYDRKHMHINEGHFAFMAYEDLKKDIFMPEEMKGRLDVIGCYKPWAAEQQILYSALGMAYGPAFIKGGIGQLSSNFDERFGEGKFEEIFFKEKDEFERISKLIDVTEVAPDERLVEDDTDHDIRFRELMGEVLSIKPNDGKACDKAMERLYDILAEAEDEIPGYKESRIIAVTDLRNDLMTLKEGHGIGSLRLLRGG